MQTLTIRSTTASLPSIEESDLEPVETLETRIGQLMDFRYTDAELRMLELHQTRLLGGRVTALSTQRARFDDLRVDSVEFTGCDLASLQLHGSKLTRVIFRDTKLLAAHINDTSMHDVVFERCNLDLATFENVTATGPLIFTGCTLTEATFANNNLAGAVFDSCRLRDTSFGPGTYTSTDLRGNNIAEITGVTHLKRTIIDRHQLTDLAAALADDLSLSFGDDT
jgi:uncharacterized protein YjbI with pentapeptide repeats